MSAGHMTQDFVKAGLRAIEGDAALAREIGAQDTGAQQFVAAGSFAIAPVAA